MLSLVDGDSGWIACTLDPSREADPFPFHTSLNAGGCRSNTSRSLGCARRAPHARPTLGTTTILRRAAERVFGVKELLDRC